MYFQIQCGCESTSLKCPVVHLDYQKTTVEATVPVGDIRHREIVTIVTLLVVFLCLTMIIYTVFTTPLNKNKVE